MELNTRQSEAVEQREGALLILAGAGSGKTRVLVHRIARILEDARVRPWEILAVTFTNKAAGELVERCRSMVGPLAEGLWVGTFHGIAARLLRRHAEVLGFKPSFTIFDRDDQNRLIKDIVKELGLDPAVFHHDMVRAFLEKAKNEAVAPGETDPGGDLVATRLAQTYGRYQARLERLGAMDFGDLILNVIRLFRTDPDLLAAYQKRFRQVLVDEYQDTNHAQYLMVSMLAAAHGNICVVGDDDQSIYAWRGADIRNILEFERDFPGARVIHLDQNYRSTSNIIEAAAAVIANNRNRMGKAMWTANDGGEAVGLFTAVDERDEARFIADRVEALDYDRNRAAIFYRTHAQSRPIEEELVRRAIPYVILGGTRFYERQEVRDLIAYLRFAANPLDDLALARIINTPARGIGRRTWERLVEAARGAEVAVWKVAAGAKVDGLGTAASSRVAALAALAGPWIEAAAAGTVTPLLERIIDEVDYLSHLERRGGEDADSRVENVRELITVAQSFDAGFDARKLDPEDPGLGPLETFLEQLALASDIDGYEAKGGAVSLMTVHNSKGLEFDDIIMAGMEEGLFPHGRAGDGEADGLEEERRLCYVGMTRARRRLTLVHASSRHVFGTWQRNLPSRFLDELPQGLVDRKRSRAARLPGPFASSIGGLEKESYGPSDGGAEGGSQRRYSVGSRVVHPMFGTGKVLKATGSGEGEKLVVRFQKAGLKKLVARYARLELI